MLVSLDRCLDAWFALRPSLQLECVDKITRCLSSGGYFVDVLVSIRGRARFYYCFLFSDVDFDGDLNFIKVV